MVSEEVLVEKMKVYARDYLNTKKQPQKGTNMGDILVGQALARVSEYPTAISRVGRKLL